jgi:hypothetical protein
MYVTANKIFMTMALVLNVVNIFTVVIYCRKTHSQQ